MKDDSPFGERVTPSQIPTLPRRKLFSLGKKTKEEKKKNRGKNCQSTIKLEKKTEKQIIPNNNAFNSCIKKPRRNNNIIQNDIATGYFNGKKRVNDDNIIRNINNINNNKNNNKNNNININNNQDIRNCLNEIKKSMQNTFNDPIINEMNFMEQRINKYDNDFLNKKTKRNLLSENNSLNNTEKSTEKLSQSSIISFFSNNMYEAINNKKNNRKKNKKEDDFLSQTKGTKNKNRNKNKKKKYY